MVLKASKFLYISSCEKNRNDTNQGETMKKLFAYMAIGLAAVFGYMSFGCGATGWAAEKVASFEGITEYRLENGLKVVLFPDASKPVATVNMTYLVGSRYEGCGETGMAHLLEHLMFKGSKNHQDLDREIAALGGMVNATTSYDRTNYFEVLPASETNLAWALEMEADRMLNAFIAKKDLDTEMTVVRNEYEMGENDPVAILRERMSSSAYLWHNYGHSVIGARSDIENVPIERLQAFYRKYYQPDNAILVIAGNFSEQQAMDLVVKYFGKMKRPQRALIPTYTVEPAQDGERTVTLRRTGNSRALGVGYHIPAAAHPDYAAVQVLTEILAGESGRLYKALVESGKAVGIQAEADRLKDAGLVCFLANLRMEQDAAEVREKMLAVLTDAGTIPPTSTELELARKKILNGMEEALNSPEYMGIQLSEWISRGDWRLFFLHRQRLQNVTAEDVARVAKTYLIKENRTLGEFIPTTDSVKVEIPQVSNLEQTLKTIQPDQTIALGEVFDTSPKSIDARTIVDEAGDGLKMAFLPKSIRGQMVEVSMALHFGSAESLKNKALAGEMAAALLLKGTVKHSREEIEQLFVFNRANVSINGDASGILVSVRAPKDQLSAVLTLVAEALREPAFSEKEFYQYKQEVFAYLEESKTAPERLAMNAAYRRFAPYEKGDIRYVMDFDEEIAELQKLTLEDVKQYYREFYGANQMEIAMVGDVDPRAMAQELRGLFGDWRSKASYQRIKNPFLKIEPTQIKILVPEKENAVFIAAAPVKMTKGDPDYPALVAANHIIGGSGLNSRLSTRIRNQEGLSYHVGSALAIGEENDFGRLLVRAICAPQNMANVEKAFKEEIVRALQSGFDQAELKDAKQGILENLKLSRAMDANLARSLRNNLYYHRNFSETAQLEAKIQALTAQDVVDALRRHIAANAFTMVKAGSLKP